MSSAVAIRWARRDEFERAGAFLAATAVASPDYISHGEIQAGLSEDGKSWSMAAGDLYAKEFERISSAPDRFAVAVAHDEGSALFVAVAVVEMTREPVAHAILHDLAVAPQERGRGIGKRVASFVESEMREKGFAWLFLESGERNAGAQRFFERLAYRKTSLVYAKPLNAR